MKSQLWEIRLDVIRRNQTNDWKLSDLRHVLKGLRRNQSRDPNGMLNEIFSPGVIGEDFELAILSLVNGMKTNQFFPNYVIKENIATIYKGKGSRLSLQNDRGIFLQTILKKIFDGLLYKDKYDHIDKSMSDSNIGARKKKMITNHLFVVNGIINLQNLILE